MIIQAARLGVGMDVAALTRHVFAGAANEAITVLDGDPDDLAVMERDAAEAGKRYAIRHFKLNPAATISRVEAAQVMRDLAAEFGFATARCVVVEHTKPRATAGGYERHWHLLVPEWDPVRRRVLDAHWMHPRQEKIARLAELRLGHAPVIGRWNAAVARALVVEGHADAATAIAQLAEAPRPGSAYTASRHQAAARRGVPLPEAKAMVIQAWARSDTTAVLAAALAETGMILRAGDKGGVWLVELDRQDGSAPVLIGALHRLLRQPKGMVDARMQYPAVPERGKVVAEIYCVGTALPAPQDSGGADRHSGGDPAGPRYMPPALDTIGAVRQADECEEASPHGEEAWQTAADGGQTDREAPGRAVRHREPDDVHWLLRGPGDTGRADADPPHRETARSRGLSREDQPRRESLPPIRHLGIRRLAPSSSAQARRRRWITLCLRRAYDLDWVPESMAARIVAVDWHAQYQALVLTLDTGTWLVDRYDQIDLVGVADDVAIAELVACVQRRGWRAVKVTGSDEFRADAARTLLAAGTEVKDPPLSDAEVDTLTAAARWQSPQPPEFGSFRARASPIT